MHAEGLSAGGALGKATVRMRWGKLECVAGEGEYRGSSEKDSTCPQKGQGQDGPLSCHELRQGDWALGPLH